MNEFAKMDIFFVVTTVAVAALSIVVFLIGLKVWRILAYVERIVEIAADETELIKEDIDDFRSDIRRKGFSVFGLGRFIHRLFGRVSRHSKKGKAGE